MPFKSLRHDGDQHVQDCNLCEEASTDEVDIDQVILKRCSDFHARIETLQSSFEIGTFEVTKQHLVLEVHLADEGVRIFLVNILS